MALILKGAYIIDDWTDEIRKDTGVENLFFYYIADKYLWEDPTPILASYQQFNEGDKVEGEVIVKTFTPLVRDRRDISAIILVDALPKYTERLEKENIFTNMYKELCDTCKEKIHKAADQLNKNGIKDINSLSKCLEEKPPECMREFTKEESKQHSEYVNSISKPTGRKFQDGYSNKGEENDE